MSEQQTITVTEFEERLAAICLGGRGSVFPRRLRDRHILYRSVVSSLNASAPLSEEMVNAALRHWLSAVALHIEIDYVALRRYLIDEGYLARSQDGSAYTVHPSGRGEVAFEAAVSAIDSAAVVEAGRARATARRREQSERQGTAQT